MTCFLQSSFCLDFQLWELRPVVEFADWLHQHQCGPGAMAPVRKHLAVRSRAFSPHHEVRDIQGVVSARQECYSRGHLTDSADPLRFFLLTICLWFPQSGSPGALTGDPGTWLCFPILYLRGTSGQSHNQGGPRGWGKEREGRRAGVRWPVSLDSDPLEFSCWCS